MIAIIICLVFLLLFILMLKGPSIWNDEVETTTTISESEPQYNVVGFLPRQFEGNQAFVLDPVDGEKVWLNSNDDRYEDAAGKVWGLR